MRQPAEFTVSSRESYDALVLWLSGASVHGMMIDRDRDVSRYRVYTGPGFLGCIVQARRDGVGLMDGLMDDERLPVPSYQGQEREAPLPPSVHNPVFNYHDDCGDR